MSRPFSAIAPLGVATMLLLSLPLTACDLFGGSDDIAGLIESHNVSLKLDGKGLRPSGLSAQARINPASFLPATKAETGRDATAIDVLQVHVDPKPATSVGVGAWDELFDTALTVAFVLDDNTSITVATKSTPPGLDRVTLGVTTSKEALDVFPQLAKGEFSIRLSGPSPKTNDDGFSLPVVVSVEFLTY